MISVSTTRHNIITQNFAMCNAVLSEVISHKQGYALFAAASPVMRRGVALAGNFGDRPAVATIKSLFTCPKEEQHRAISY